MSSPIYRKEDKHILSARHDIDYRLITLQFGILTHIRKRIGLSRPLPHATYAKYIGGFRTTFRMTNDFITGCRVLQAIGINVRMTDIIGQCTTR